MASPFDLSGKVAAVTGANTGLGQGIAIALAQAGADIAAIGRSAPEETAQQVTALGRRLRWIETDLDHIAGLPAAVEQAAAQLGGLHILVNNAGTIRRNAAIDFSEQDWDAVLGVNLKTAFFLAQAFARHCLAHQQAGKIINIASLLSFQGGIRVVSYTASKSGLLGMTRLLANEWAAQGINVNAIAPGYFATSNTVPLRQDEQRNRDILARIPAGRWGEPGDLGGAAVFLASSAADYVHGAVLPVDGGWLAR
jgi:2-deoxy-D-gluconate 3-dehydrogenase